ncbi:MAG: oligoendopeptidase F [Ignavibacteriales bacterium]|nr:oligoendopeptidase F [Ignavibacteriales bacterium]
MMQSYSFRSFLFVLLFLSANSIAQDKDIPNYSTTQRKDVPEEYKWKIEDLYPNDEAWQNDKINLTKLILQIEEKSKGWTQSAGKMLEVFQLSDQIILKFQRLYNYAKRQSDMEMSNSTLQVMKGEIQSIQVELGVKLAFINDDLLKMKDGTIDKYLKQEPKLEAYRFSIEQVVRSGKHILPIEQEKLMSLTNLFSSSTADAATILNDVDKPAPEITLSTGEKVALNYANYFTYRSSKNPEDRALVMHTFWNNHKKYENTLAALFDGGMKQHLFVAKARNFKDCLEAKLFGDNIDEAVYFQLIDAVKKNLSPLHRYLKLKQKLLGLEKIKYEDVYASCVKSVDKFYTFKDAEEILLEALKPLGTEYNSVLKKAFNERWIDIYPNKDKESGAYSEGIYDVHPYIKMNYNGEYDAVSTLAHELGHAVHSYLSAKEQPFSNSNYATFIAEIASTFDENLLMDYMLKNEKDDLFKLYIIDNYLEGARATIYRQALFAEFELDMHKRVEAGKSLTADWLDSLYLDLTRTYYGHNKGVMQVDNFIQSEWGNVPHFFLNFYVFQYSTGLISSMALVQKVLSGEQGALEKYLEMLKAGGSDFPIQLLQKAGVDMTKIEPYNAAFKRFDYLVTEMEVIVERLKKDGRI